MVRCHELYSFRSLNMMLNHNMLANAKKKQKLALFLFAFLLNVNLQLKQVSSRLCSGLCILFCEPFSKNGPK